MNELTNERDEVVKRSTIKTVECDIRGLDLGVEGVLDEIGVFLHDVHVMVVVFVFFLVLVVEDYVPFGLLNVGFEHFVGRVGQFDPFIELIFEQVVPDIRVAIRDADIVALSFQHSGYFL
jgi:hypothetical protein